MVLSILLAVIVAFEELPGSSLAAINFEAESISIKIDLPLSLIAICVELEICTKR